MTTRWDVERALRGSDLPAAARHVALALLSRTEAGTAGVPAEHSPSLARLARDTGYSRREVAYCLSALESRGWVTRLRDLERAHAEKRPTRYRLHVPASARGALVQEVHQSTSARGAPALVQEVHRTSASVAPNQNLNQTSVRSSRVRGREPADVIRAAYPDATDDEIEIMIKDRIANGARSPVAVLAHEIREGTLRLPCGSGPGPHSSACRDGDPGGCGMDWCTCRCHTEPKATP